MSKITTRVARPILSQ